MGTRRFAYFISLLIAIGAVPLGTPQPVAAVSTTLVINEVDYDQVGTDSLEYVELKNVSGGPIDLTGYSVEFMNGSSGTAAQYQNIALSGSVVAGGYVVICGGTVANCNFDSVTNTDYIQNGPTDAIAIRQGASFIDALGYEGPITNSPAYTEGTATNTTVGSGADSNTAGGSLNRCSDGTDTDNNDNDFEFRSTLTPGAANDCPGGLPTLSINDVTQSEGNAGTSNFLFTVSLSAPAGPGGVTFDIAAADGTAQDDNPNTEDEDYVAQSLTGQTIPAGSSSYTFTVVVNGDTEDEPNETFSVSVTNVTGATVTDAQGLGTIVDDEDSCGDTYTPIHDIQGNSTSVPVPGTYTTEGIVVGDFEGPTTSGLQGFYIQEPTADADPMTSEGIFVFTGDNDNGVALGERVRVSGYARETNNQSAIHGSNSSTAPVINILECSTGNQLPTPTDLTMPESMSNLEPYEGMHVRFPETLVIAEYFNYARFGEIVLAEPLTGESRPFSGTAIDEPGAAANARTAANQLRRITLDDGLASQNPPTLRHPNGSPFSLTNYFRGGDQVTNTVGVLGYGFSLYRIQPNGAATFTATNPRPTVSPATGGRLRVAAQNTLNYFLTPDIDPTGPGDNACGASQTLECRGWDSNQPAEFQRQRDKLIATLIGLDADVIGLNEIENTPGVEPAADIVAGMNAILGAATYNYIDTGVIGTDAIRVGMIYRVAAVAPIGHPSILDSTVDPRFIDTRSRPVLAQTFEEVATGALFTVAVNHLKSKGSACTGDPDTGDGQGNCNVTRTEAARALVDWLATDPTNSGDSDFLIIGDLNAYAMEDPIDAIKAGPDDTAGTADDYTNLVAQYLGTYAYSYVFDGQAGYLDHALSSAGLTSQVTGVAEWHINADEVPVFDYDMSFKPNDQDALYEPEAYRSSDHDPVIVGLNLSAECETAPFSDVPVDHPFCPLINWVKVNGVANGFPNGSYQPDADVTRQAMAAFLTRLAGATPEACAAEPFSDVPTGHPFCAEINWMEANDVANGYEDGTYRPARYVSRQAMAAFLTRIAEGNPPACTGPEYSDVPADHTFCAEIGWIRDRHITNGYGDGTFRPAAMITRQAMAAFIARTLYWMPVDGETASDAVFTR